MNNDFLLPVLRSDTESVHEVEDMGESLCKHNITIVRETATIHIHFTSHSAFKFQFRVL